MDLNIPRGDIEALVTEAFGLGQDHTLELCPIVKGGSSRSFTRVRLDCPPWNLIFVHYSSDQRENSYYAGITTFLDTIGISVPRIYHHDATRCFILMEDAGELDLWHYRTESWKTRKEYYCQTMDMLHKLHAVGPGHPGIAGTPLMEGFDLNLYRWERSYFLQRFVNDVTGITLEGNESEALEREHLFMTEKLMARELRLVHRDLQSQNIMIRNEKPVLIDYQGMRFGTPFYDLGSLLYDPYVPFTNREREELLRYYYESRPSGQSHGGWEDFQEMFHLGSAQRLMQALGAYGFLGLHRNQRAFLAHIPSGLANLIEVTAKEPQLNQLMALALRCRDALAGQNFKPRE